MKTISDFPNYSITKEGKVWSKRRKIWRKSFVNNHGYLVVVLFKNKKKCTKQIHRLILETFVGPCPKNMESRHLNGDKLCCKLFNLKWGTKSENSYDALKHGTHPGIKNKGENHPMAKLTERNVKRIKRMLKNGVLQKVIAKIFSINPSMISYIKTGRYWAY